MKRTGVLCAFLVLSLVLAVYANPLSAISVVMLNDLPQGKAVSLQKDGGVPLFITNDSPETVTMEVEAQSPRMVELRAGYEPIPDLSWVRFPQSRFSMRARSTTQFDVVITVPAGMQFQGKRYQLNVWAHTVGKNVVTGIKSKVLFSVKK
jgi:hypothetical protein